MALTIHHYYQLSSDNIGDHLVAHAIRSAVQRYFGPVKFVDLPVNDHGRLSCQPRGLCGANLERTNREADLVIVGGTNLLEPVGPRQASPRYRTGWGVSTNIASLRAIRPPLLLLGMGIGSDWNWPIGSYPASTAEQIRTLHDKAFAVAVRDQRTVERLAQLGIDSICTGCPVNFLTDRSIMVVDADRPLLVSLPPARILNCWSGRRFVQKTMRYLNWLRREDVPFIACAHQPEDLKRLAGYLPSGSETFQTDRIDELIARFQDCSGVIGFRLQAAQLAMGLGKPTIPVAIDWRGRAMIETFDLHHGSIDASHWGQFQKLRRLTGQLLDADPELIERLNREKTRFHREFHSFLRRAAAEFSRQTSLPAAAIRKAA